MAPGMEVRANSPLFEALERRLLLSATEEALGGGPLLLNDELDFGDAPDPTYPTLLVSNGARHVIGGPWLGDNTDTPDAELDGQPDPMAQGDDTDGNDDEDGVRIPVLSPNLPATVWVQVNGGGGQLDAWIDWHADGTFDEPMDRIFSGLLPNGMHGINVVPPPNAILGHTYSRFRINTGAPLLPEGAAQDGEVEDHLVHIRQTTIEVDDFPNSSGTITIHYPDGTNDPISLTGPVTQEVYFEGDQEGHAEDDDGNGLEEVDTEIVELSLTGEGLTGPVTLRLRPAEFAPGVMEEMENAVDNLLDVAPFNYDGLYHIDSFFDITYEIEFDGAGGQVLHTEDPIRMTGTLTYKPAEPGQSYTSDDTVALLDPEGNETGFSLTVRDWTPYANEEMDFGDAPESPDIGGYPTTLALNGARHMIGGPWLGDRTDSPDGEPDGQPEPNALGDDLDITKPVSNDDEDGAQIPILVQGVPDNITVEVNGGNGGVVEVWVDFDGDMQWAHPGEQIFSGHLPDGFHNIPVTAPPGSVVGQTFARFRISRQGGLRPTGYADNGEVEDHEVFIEEGHEELDFGDAPTDPAVGDYPTLLIHNGARHLIGGPWLGDNRDKPDPEADGQPENLVPSDDHDGNDDENGVQIPILMQGTTSMIQYEVNGGGGYVEGWIDWNGDWQWDASEQVLATGLLPNGTYTQNVTPPANAIAGRTFARFRISGQRLMTPVGFIDNGEVEDHEVFIEEGERLDWGDAPTDLTGTKYPTLAIGNGANHVIGGPWLGDLSDGPDPEGDGQPDPNAMGDDNDGNDDEDGAQIPILVQGVGDNIKVEVNSASGGGGVVEVWVDWNGDSTWAHPGEQIFSGHLPDGFHNIPVTAPFGSVLGQTFARFRISRQGVGSPVGPAPDGEVEDHEVFIEEGERLDWGDAPDAVGALGYPTLAIHNGANHVIGGPWLGDASDSPDPEGDGQPDPNAMGDDNDGNDDEDGAQIPVLVQGVGDNIKVEVNGGGGVVEVWVDWNGDKTWAHPGEQIFSGWLPDGFHNIPVTAPFGSVLGQTFARFRISSQGGLTPEGPAHDGEVEDHEVFIEEGEPLDFGDAPTDPAGLNYPTLLIGNGANHLIGGPWLGDLSDNPDAEPDGQPDPNALGDDNDGNDDEDGAQIPILVQGVGDNIKVEVNSASGGGGVVEVWIDWNGDKTWAHPGERIFSGHLPDGFHNIPVTAPFGSVLGQTFARFRISRQGGLAPTGFADNGEVEDHEVFIEEGERLDWGDAPDGMAAPGYPTLAIHNGANHVIGGPWLGDASDSPDPEGDGQPDPNALGDDNDGNDDEDGAQIPVLIQGVGDNIKVEVNGGGGVVEVWVDFDGDKTWAHPGEQIFSGWLPDGFHNIPVTAPFGSVLGQTFARFRISNQGGLTPEGPAQDGEVEDHEVFIEEGEQLDWGDAPEPAGFLGYPTTLAKNGARHVIGGPWLGDASDSPDPEADGQPDPNALGDDNDGNDDEDGVIVSPLAPGHSGAVIVKINDGAGGGGVGGAFLDAWIDFNGDRTWQAAETIHSGWLPHGANVVTFFVPAGSVIGQTFGRFRVSANGGLGPVGPATDGEVEDHEVTIYELPDNAKWVQWPDLTPRGIDIRVDGSDPRRVLADDFRCTENSLLTDVHLWCSWLGDEVGEIANIHLSIHEDDPAGPDGMREDNQYSMPGELLWDYDTEQYSMSPFYMLLEGKEWWWDPAGNVLRPDGDSQVWQIDIQIDPSQAFEQKGTPDEPRIYWLDVHVDVVGSGGTDQPQIGWKTRQWPDHYMDDAVWWDGLGWRELRYPAGHPYHGIERDSIDMAFMLTFEEISDRIDFGDAPEIPGAAGYPTTLVNNGARHVIGGPWLGDNTDSPDPEPNGQPDPNALGDDNDGNDDEDGVNIPVMLLGQTVPVTFEVNGIAPGTTAIVEGWFDWDGDRTWQPGELEINGSFGPGMHMVPVTVPTSAVLGQTFARFRISINGTGGSPVGLAPDGEVEDHELFIEEQPTEDFGDAPDSAFVPGYPTLLISNGARHTLDVSGPWLGGGMFGPDGEFDGQPDPNALGDDNDGGDDEDGVTIPILQQGVTSGIGITVHGGGGGGGFVDAWIDWNGNKQWEASEQIHSGWLAHGSHTIPVTPSASSVVGRTFARFRISRQGGLLPTGPARDGEVEDYELFIEEGEFDFGDAPERVTGMGYPTTLALNGAHHVIAGPWLGDGTDWPDAEPDGQPQNLVPSDDNDGNDDEDGVNIPILQIGASSTITVQVHSGGSGVAGGFVEAWIDWNGNMQWEASELIFAGLLPPGPHPISVTPPAGSIVGQTFARFRISSQGTGSPVGPAPDGEVEDHEVFIEEGELLDFGDAPDNPQLPGYPTLLAHNGARHVIRGPWMGDPNDNPDGETDGQPDGTATGDDLLDGNDDEDGVQIPTLMQGRPDKIRVEIDDGGTGLGGAFLDAWIDWNQNKVWEPGEQIHAGFLLSGVNHIPVTPPAGAVTGRTFARFRVSTHGGLLPTGLANDGEVEDHILEVTDAPPQVTNVYVSGSAWVAAFLNHIQALGLGSSTYGYSIPVGSSAQLDTLPWVNLDQLSIAFSEPVNVAMADLGVYGVHVPSYSFSGFVYNAADMVATWTFTSDMDNDKYLIDLSDAVTDLSGGNQLDGEWTQTVSTYPSGDFVAGTDFRFRYNVLPGDVDQSGEVRASDTIKVRRKSNTVPGDAAYDIFYDVDGSGEIRASDTIKVRRRSNTSLPSGEPTAPPSALSAGLIAAALEAMEDDSDSLDVLALTSTIPAPLAP